MTKQKCEATVNILFYLSFLPVVGIEPENNTVQTNDYNQIKIITWKNIIIGFRNTWNYTSVLINSERNSLTSMTQLAGAAEYTICIFAKG